MFYLPKLTSYVFITFLLPIFISSYSISCTFSKFKIFSNWLTLFKKTVLLKHNVWLSEFEAPSQYMVSAPAAKSCSDVSVVCHSEYLYHTCELFVNWEIHSLTLLFPSIPLPCQALQCPSMSSRHCSHYYTRSCSSKPYCTQLLHL